jgi:hypothetical protein
MSAAAPVNPSMNVDQLVSLYDQLTTSKDEKVLKIMEELSKPTTSDANKKSLAQQLAKKVLLEEVSSKSSSKDTEPPSFNLTKKSAFSFPRIRWLFRISVKSNTNLEKSLKVLSASLKGINSEALFVTEEKTSKQTFSHEKFSKLQNLTLILSAISDHANKKEGPAIKLDPATVQYDKFITALEKDQVKNFPNLTKEIINIVKYISRDPESRDAELKNLEDVKTALLEAVKDPAKLKSIALLTTELGKLGVSVTALEKLHKELDPTFEPEPKPEIPAAAYDQLAAALAAARAKEEPGKPKEKPKEKHIETAPPTAAPAKPKEKPVPITREELDKLSMKILQKNATLKSLIDEFTRVIDFNAPAIPDLPVAPEISKMKELLVPANETYNTADGEQDIYRRHALKDKESAETTIPKFTALGTQLDEAIKRLQDAKAYYKAYFPKDSGTGRIEIS